MPSCHRNAALSIHDKNGTAIEAFDVFHASEEVCTNKTFACKAENSFVEAIRFTNKSSSIGDFVDTLYAEEST